ncbi:MAG TPA: S8 family serine peptidase [Thermoanaerobaculia bacterium]
MNQIRSLAAVLILIPLSVSAGTTTVTMATSRGPIMEVQAHDSDAVDLIVEFRDTPLFAHGPVHAASEARSAAEAFRTRFEQFAADVRPFVPRIRRTYERVFAGASVTAPRSAIAKLQQLSYVKRVYPDRRVHAMADDSVTKIEADRVWTTFGTRGHGVTVAVIDTGVDYTHPAFGGSFGPGARVAGGFDFVNNDADPMDDNGHGTHVAGTIGANGGGLTGVAPEVTFLAYKVLDNRGAGQDSDIIAAIERAVDPDQNGDPSDHADVVNLSLGGSGFEDDPLPRAVETATAAGVVFCIASGNSGGFFGIGSPGNAPSAITVGASDLSDALAVFSSGGPSGRSLRLKPEVVAPGVGIVSAAPGGGTIALSGTSMATPHVSGVAALVKSLHHDWSPSDIKSAIVDTAEVIDADTMSEGGGRVDALRAATDDVIASPSVLSFGRDDSSQNHWTSTSSIGLTNRSSQTLTLTVTTAGGAFGVNVTTDPQSFTLAAAESKTVNVTIAVDNQAVPFPSAGSLAFSGRVLLTGGAVPLHVPWAFVKSAHITARYDRDDPAAVLVLSAGGDTPMLNAGIVDPNNHLADVFVPPGVYDLQLNSFSFDGSDIVARYIFGPREAVANEVTSDFRADMAGTPAMLASAAPDGRTLSDIGRDPGTCSEVAFIVYPPESPVRSSSVAITSNTGSHLHIAASPRHDGISLTASEACWDGASSLYVAQHGDISTIDANGKIAVDPSTWKRAPINVLVPEHLKNPAVVFGPAFVTSTPANISLTGDEQLHRLPVTGTAWNGTLFITPERHPIKTTAAVLRVVADTISSPGTTVMDGHMLRGTDDGVLIWPYRTVGPIAYVAKSGEPLTFGGNPKLAQISVEVLHDNLSVGGGLIGPLGELQPLDASATTVTVRDASGVTVPSFGPLAPGVYEAEVTTGTSKFLGRVDSRLPDSMDPLITLLRIVNEEGQQTAVIHHNEHATLRFAALDFLLSADGNTFDLQLVDAAKTSASWRAHGSPFWLPLAVTLEKTEIARNFDEVNTVLGHPAAGSIFSSDLTAAIQTDGAVDLRLHVEDPSGNSVDYELDEAFTVGPARTRAVRR